MQILAGLILLGVLIVFHELGHFLFAKLLGVRVLVFSVGFGPKLFGFNYKGTEYRLSAIPLGGYIRMFGESLEEELTEEEKKMSFMHQPIWRKSLIAVAGPLFNFILPVFLFFGLLIGSEKVFAPKVGTLLPDSPADKAGMLVGDVVKRVDGVPIESFSDLATLVSKSPGQKLNFDIERKVAEQTATLTIPITPEAKAEPNPFAKDKMVGRVGIMPGVERPIILVGQNSPFAQLGLRNFDEIKAINNVEINSNSELIKNLKNIKPGDIIKANRSDNNNQIIFVTVAAFDAPIIISPEITQKGANFVEQNWITQTENVLRDAAREITSGGILGAKGGITDVAPKSIAETLGLAIGDKIVAFDGQPFLSDRALQEVAFGDNNQGHVLGVVKNSLNLEILRFVLPDASNDVSLDATLLSTLGLKTASVFAGGETIERKVGAVEAVSRAVSQTYDIAALTAQSLWMLVKGDVSTSQVGGPIMLFDVAQQAAAKGLPYYIFIMCMLSVNLGLLNLIPIPALDGGHLLLFGIEAVQRKPLTAKTRAIATQIGITVLLLLMGLAIFNDLKRLFG